MASEIRVDKINSLSGVGTVTLSPTGVDIAGITTVSTLKVGTGVTASEDGDIFFTGIATATTFSGSGASLTALPAAQVTGTLPAISGANLTSLNGSNIASGTVADARISTLTASKLSGALPAISALNLTNVPAANVVGVHTSLNITGATVVGSAVTISESGIEASGIGITCANINGTQIGGRRNLVINGDFRIAQRATTATVASAIATVDRWFEIHSGEDETPTQSQVDVASGTSPYAEGLRKAFRITNGNQSSIEAGDFVGYKYVFEAQDIANSGWNYTSSSSFVTLSFWIKTSVTNVSTGNIRTFDSSPVRSFKFDVSTTANTWKKVVLTVPGNSNLVFDNNTGAGLVFHLYTYLGTTYRASDSNTETWIDGSATTTYGNNTVTNTFWNTNDATVEITGVQFEVGSQATPFEHRTKAEELRLCQRYFYKNTSSPLGAFAADAGDPTVAYGFIRFPVAMRTAPTVVLADNAGNTDGKVTQHGAAHNIAATAQQIQTEGFARCKKTSGNWNTNSGYPIAASVTSAEAEL